MIDLLTYTSRLGLIAQCNMASLRQYDNLLYIPLASYFGMDMYTLQQVVILPELEEFMKGVKFEDSVSFNVSTKTRLVTGCNVYNLHRLYKEHTTANFVEQCVDGIMLWFNPHCSCSHHLIKRTRPDVFNRQHAVMYASSPVTGQLCYLRLHTKVN